MIYHMPVYHMPADVFDPSINWQGVCKHLVVNVPYVGIVRCSKNPVDAREKNIQQRAKSLSLAAASGAGYTVEKSALYRCAIWCAIWQWRVC